MEFFGSLERLLASLYPYRAPLAALLLALLTGVAWAATRRGWYRAPWRFVTAHRAASAAGAVLVLATAVPLGNYLLSPLWERSALIEVSGLLFVVFVGAPHLGAVDLFAVQGGATGFLGAAALVFFAYIGFEEIATLSEEVKDQTRTIPAALLVAVAVTTLIYVLVSAVAVSVVPWPELAAVVARAAGPRFGDAISYIALFATFNTVLLFLATGPRAMYGMARRGLVPPVIGRVWAARGTPWVAILFSTGVSLAFVVSGDIGFVAQVTNFAVFTLFVVVNGAVMRLRFTQPDTARPFRVRPAVAGIPLPSLVGLSGAHVLAAYMDRSAFVVGCGALLLGLALSFVLVQREPGEGRGEC